MGTKLTNIRDDRLYHITANWSTEQKHQYTRDFLICAASKQDAEYIARNHIPNKVNTTPEPDKTTDIRLRIRDLGLSQKNRTYFVSEITTTTREKPEEMSLLETAATHFAYLLGAEYGTLNQTQEPSEEQTNRLTGIINIPNKKAICWQWAAEYWYQKELDADTFFYNKLNELTQTTNTPVNITAPTNSISADNILEQAKQQADIIIAQANNTAATIIANAEKTAAILLEQTKSATITVQPANQQTQTEPEASENIQTDPETTPPEEKTEPEQQTDTAASDETKPVAQEQTTTETSDVKQPEPEINFNDTALTQMLTTNFTKAKQWLETLPETQNPDKVNCKDLADDIIKYSDELMHNLLDNTKFETDTQATPFAYYETAIKGDTEANDEDKGLTTLAVLASIRISESETLFQKYANEYIQGKIAEIYTAAEPQTESVMPDEDFFNDDLYNIPEDENEDYDEPDYEDDDTPNDM